MVGAEYNCIEVSFDPRLQCLCATVPLRGMFVVNCFPPPPLLPLTLLFSHSKVSAWQCSSQTTPSFAPVSFALLLYPLLCSCILCSAPAYSPGWISPLLIFFFTSSALMSLVGSTVWCLELNYTCSSDRRRFFWPQPSYFLVLLSFWFLPRISPTIMVNLMRKSCSLSLWLAFILPVSSSLNNSIFLPCQKH